MGPRFWLNFLQKIRTDAIRAQTLMATHNTSLSSHVAPSDPKCKINNQDNVPLHASTAGELEKLPGTQPCKVERLMLNVQDDRPAFVPAFLHTPQNFERTPTAPHGNAAAILISGAAGGVVGPSSIYLSIADKLASLDQGMPVMRLDFRYPARNTYCVRDVREAMRYLSEDYGVARFVLVGWSFGGAPVFTIAAEDERVLGCATIASQTAETHGVTKLAPRPLLLLHGLADQRLSYRCAEMLYKGYGKGGDRRMQLFEGDDHSLTKNALIAEEMLCDFIIRCAGVMVGGKVLRDVAAKDIMPPKEREENMKKGGDIDHPEGLQ